jgi:D-psicose/D-tagatose/L-ribulose 3-epimerase
VSDSTYPFPLAIQTVLPQEIHNRGFREKLDLLQEWGFSGIELNIGRPEQIDPVELKSLLAEHGLKMTMFASGATAKAEGLSLSHEDGDVRATSVQRCKEFLDFAAEFGAGVIVGFLKGGVSQDRDAARDRFREAVGRVEVHARAMQVPLLIEATNRYESSAVNSLQDAADLILAYRNPYLRVLPDTFHMNIEESSMTGALVKHVALYDSLHISDNNRLFPGLGAIDFFAILRFLKEAGYAGSIAIEGNLRDSFQDDLRASMSVLRPMLLQL